MRIEAGIMAASLFKSLLVVWLIGLGKSAPSCNSTDLELVERAFSSVSGFDYSAFLSSGGDCIDTSIKEINLPSRNLSGPVSWAFLSNLSQLQVIDLSGNSLQGSVPGRLWTMPALVEVNLAMNLLGGSVEFDEHGQTAPSALRKLNLSSNRFTNSFQLSGFRNLETLDLSNNNLRWLPWGFEKLEKLKTLDLSRCNIAGGTTAISNLQSLRYLDLSFNFMNGSFPSDLPALERLEFLNLSFNNFSGSASPAIFQRFSKSAFEKSGISIQIDSITPTENPNPRAMKHKSNKGVKRKWFLGSVVSAAAVVGAIAALLACRYRKKKKGMVSGGKWAKPEPYGPLSFETDVKAPSSAPVVMFEKPLLNLTFSDLIAATSRFGKDSQLADGRGGPVYRAVLPGDIHVAIKVLEEARAVADEEAAAAFEELSRLKHPNLLPLLGYCISGGEKLLLHEFMANGDLRRWLHELPAGKTNVEDWSADAWEQQQQEGDGTGWPTRHRIALGIARGLAYLHHSGARPLVHGRVDSAHILLADDLEPRVAGFISPTIGEGTGPGAEADVYAFGVVLLELLTGKTGSEEVVARVRGLVKDGHGAAALDPRLLRLGSDSAIGMMSECLRIGYLCTAASPEKRPTMQQVVGLIKDIRPPPPAS